MKGITSVNRLWIVLPLCSLVAGCAKVKAEKTARVSLTPTVKVTQPERRDIRLSIGQPGQIEPYERTAIFSKVAGFVQKWYVDIGAHVKKDELLVELLVPELDEEHKEKEALVIQQKAMVDQAEKLVTVAQSNLQAATDAVAEAQHNAIQFQAGVDYWTSQLHRLEKVGTALNSQVVPETKKTIDEKQADYEAAESAVKTKESQKLAAAAQVEKAKADLAAARAQVDVAEAAERRLRAMFAYTKIMAPYDGVITTRNVNTGDFVRPASGDSSEGRSGPLLVIARTDPVMFVIDVPEIDAPYVSVGTKASLRLQALASREFNVQVTRTSLALNNKSRTLQTEIDLPNPHNELLPGMYAYGTIEIERPKVWAIPASSTVQIGNRMCCYLVNDGTAVRSQIQSGVSDGNWIEVVKRRIYPNSGDPGKWEDFNGAEEVVAGDLSEIADGKAINVDRAR
jgi:HlyD family secretion protein